MTSKIRIRFGDIEVEYEGPESFLQKELQSLLKAVADLHGSVPPVTPKNSSQDSDNPSEAQSVTTIARKLGATKCPDLIMAAALRMTLGGAKQFSKKNVRDEMKNATGFYKSSYASNFDATLDRLVKAGRISHISGENYALPAKEKSALSTRVAQ